MNTGILSISIYSIISNNVPAGPVSRVALADLQSLIPCELIEEIGLANFGDQVH